MNNGRFAGLLVAALLLTSLPVCADEAFVTTQGADALDSVDLATLSVVATLKIGQ